MNIVNKIKENEGIIVLVIIVIIFGISVGVFRHAQQKHIEEEIIHKIDSAYQAGKNDTTKVWNIDNINFDENK